MLAPRAALCFVAVLSLSARAAPPTTTRPATQPAPDPLLEALLRPPPPGSVEVLPGLFAHAQFTAFRPSKGEKPPGKPADVLRLSEDPQYGISLLLFPAPEFKGGEIRYREVLTLPAKPGGWGEGFDAELAAALRHKQTISPDGRACTTEITFPVRPDQIVPAINVKAVGPDGREDEFRHLLYPFPIGPWGLADDDPPGHWTIEGFINDKPVARATFTVVIADAPDHTPPPEPQHPTSRPAR